MVVYLGFDVGGTKIRAYQVIPAYDGEKLTDAQLGENVFSVPELSTKKFTDPERLNEMIHHSIERFGDSKDVVVSGSIAGITDKKTLGAKCANIKYPLTFLSYLRERGYRSFIYNDLFAAGTALARLGPGKDYSVVAVQNAGSGNNVACARNGIVFTEGTEAGHQAYIDGGIFCGCGKPGNCGSGHLETYASGTGAATMAVTYFKNHSDDRTHLILEEALKDWNLENEQNFGIEKLQDDSFWREIIFYIEGKHVMTAYSRDKESAKAENRNIQNPQREIRRLQRNGIAHQLGQITAQYQPPVIIIRGSFVTKNWADLGQPAVDRYLEDYSRFAHPEIPTPKVERKKVKKDGVKGAVLCAIDDLKAA